MTAVALKRGAPARKRGAAPRRASAPALVRLPLPPGRLARHFATGLVTLLVLAGLLVATALGVPQRLWQQVAQMAARAGFEVRHIDVSGTDHAAKLGIYAAAFNGASNSMLLVDLAEVRARLRALPWIADASVTRRLPDTLVVRVTERMPVAIWQFHHHLVAVDRTGAVLTDQHLDSFAHLPLIVGGGANRQAHLLLALLSRSPRVGATVDAATLVGERRWDLRFRTGETLALPEGEAAAAAALARFAAIDAHDGLLGRGFARFDMRLPGRLTVRLRSRVESATAKGGGGKDVVI